MPIYFKDSEVPELRSLTPTQRRLIIRQGLALLSSYAPFFRWLPTLLGVIGGVIGFFGGAIALVYLYPVQPFQGNFSGERLTLSMIGSYAGMGIGALSAGFIGSQVQWWKLRPFLKSVASDYGLEIPHAT